MKRLVIMQPSYLPWLGYFDLLLQSDLFLIYDNVQFDKDGWRNRNKIKSANGPQWLTVPVLTKGQNKPLNSDIQVNGKENWQTKHLKTLQMCYSKAPHFKEVFPLIETVLQQRWNLLLDVNLAFLKTFCEFLDIATPMQKVSELSLALPDGKNEKLIAICRHLSAEEFYEPEGGRGYIDESQFTGAGIRLKFQNFQHPVYPQLYGDFVSHLSIVDVLFNCGRQSAQILREASSKSFV